MARSNLKSEFHSPLSDSMIIWYEYNSKYLVLFQFQQFSSFFEHFSKLIHHYPCFYQLFVEKKNANKSFASKSSVLS